MESVELKTAKIKVKNLIADFNIPWDTAKARIRKLKTRENIPAEAQREEEGWGWGEEGRGRNVEGTWDIVTRKRVHHMFRGSR